MDSCVRPVIWILNDESNRNKLSKALKALKYPTDAIQTGISELKRNRNISLKHGQFFKVEIISFLSSTLAFKEAYERKEIKTVLGLSVGVVDFDDLCFLKIKSGRNKDWLDINELKRIRNDNS